MGTACSALAAGSLFTLCQRLCTAAGTDPVEGPDCIFYPGTGLPSFYRRVYIKPLRSRIPGLPEHLKALLAQPGPSPAVCFVREEVHPLLEQDLASIGLIPTRVQTGMVLPLAAIAHAGPDARVICIPRTRLKEWAGVCQAAFGKPDELPAFERLWDTCRFYAYETDGRLVATAMLQPMGSTCSLHEVGTLPEYRGRGIANALLRQLLAHAGRSGCTAVGLQSSDAGLPTYRRLGFQVINHICHYALPTP